MTRAVTMEAGEGRDGRWQVEDVLRANTSLKGSWKNMGIKLNHNDDWSIFLVVLVTYSLVTLICVCIFSCLRQRYRVVYSKNVWDNWGFSEPSQRDALVDGEVAFFEHREDLPRRTETGDPLPPRPRGEKWDWVRASRRLKTQEICGSAGLDSAMLVQFTELGVLVFGLLSVPMCLVVAPTHMFFGGNAAGDDYLSWQGFANVQQGSNLCWLHCFIVWFVVLVVDRQICRVQGKFVKWRIAWMRSMPPIQACSILVEGVPDRYRTAAALERYFNSMFGGRHVVEEVHLMVHTEQLQTLTEHSVTVRQRLQEALQVREAEMLREAAAAPAVTDAGAAGDPPPQEGQPALQEPAGGSAAGSAAQAAEAPAPEGATSAASTAGQESTSLANLQEQVQFVDARVREERERVLAAIEQVEAGVRSELTEHDIASPTGTWAQRGVGPGAVVDEDDEDDGYDEEERSAGERTAAAAAAGATGGGSGGGGGPGSDDDGVPESGTGRRRQHRRHVDSGGIVGAIHSVPLEPLLRPRLTNFTVSSSLLGSVSGLYAAAGFVTFKTRYDAGMALRAVPYTSDKSEFELSVPPDPADVNYKDFLQSGVGQRAREAGGFVLMAFLAILFLPTIGFISTATRTETLGAMFPPIGAWAGAHPKSADLWNGLAGSVGITVVLSFLPTVLMMIACQCFRLRAFAWSQLRLQQWYFAFLICFQLFVVAIVRSVESTFKDTIESPLTLVERLSYSMCRTTHFFLHITIIQWVSIALEHTRWTQMGKYCISRRSYASPAETYDAVEPEDQDYYGFGARFARYTMQFVIGIVFVSLCPVMTIFVFIYFVLARLFIGYQVVFAETKKPDLGGVFWVTAAKHVQFGLLVYVSVMTAVLLERASNRYPAMISGLAIVYVIQQALLFESKYFWESLSHEEIIAYHAHEQAGEGARFRRATRTTYKQPDLVAT